MQPRAMNDHEFRVIGLWPLRIVLWDGVLPVVVWLAPFVVRFLIPNRRGAIEITAIVLPIAAFLFRLHVGRRQIARNRCGDWMRRFQLVVFCVGIVVLVLIDAVMVLIHVMPPGAVFATPGDRIVWACLYGIYMTSMAIAMYPGPHPRPV